MLGKKKDHRASTRLGAGFSLVELMVVISIIGLLSTIVAVNVLKSKGKAASQKVAADADAFKKAIILFHNDTGQYPSSLEDLIQSSGEGWEGPYIDGGAKALLDPWKRPYIYNFQGSGDPPYVFGSYGGDGQPGGDGENKDIFPFQDGGARR